MEAKDVISKWEGYLNNSELSGIVNLYLDNAVLWGTFSNHIRNNSELISEYFQSLLQKKELKVNFSSTTTRTYADISIFSGTYEFSYMEEELVIHRARYTFVVCKDDSGNYKIAEHHSSLIPN